MKHVWKFLALLCCLGLLGGCGEELPPVQTVEPVQLSSQPQSTEEARKDSATEALESAGETADASQTYGSDEETVRTEEGSDGLPAEDNRQENPKVTLVMVGDILLHTPVAKGAKKEDGSYDFNHLFAHVTDRIQAADLRLVNQEVIIGGAGLGVSGYPAFNAPYELGDALHSAGFNVILHATNHALDKGKQGLLNCLAFWQEHYPEKAILGIHGSADDSEEIYVYEQDGIRIAILNYTYGTNGIPLPDDMPYAVDLLREKKIVKDLQAAEELADFTVVCPHWGTEYTLEQTKAQKKWARLFVENGADLILGTHPHVIEPVAIWQQDENGVWTETVADAADSTLLTSGGFTADGQATDALPGDTAAQDVRACVPVFYSLGNFVNWTSGKGDGVANRMVGGMAHVTIAKQENGRVSVTEWSVEPLVSHVEQGFGNVTVYPLSQYSPELAAQNEIRSQDGNFSYEYCTELVRNVFGLSIAQEHDH